MKRTFALALLACGLSVRPPSASAEPMISLGSATVAPGGTATLSVDLNAEVLNITGIEIHLDHSAVAPAGGPALTVAALDTKSLPASLSDASFDSNEDGGAFHAAIAHADPVDGPLALTLKIQVPANATPGATYTLALTAKLTDPDGQPITVKSVNGSLIIEGGTVKKGDVDNDGTVNVSDVVLTLQFIVGLEAPTTAQQTAADANGNGMLEVGDAVRILRSVVGLEPL